jgi:hypothetical protein
LNRLQTAAVLLELRAQRYNEVERRWFEIRREQKDPTLISCFGHLEDDIPASQECIELVAEYDAVFGQLHPLQRLMEAALSDHLAALLEVQECVKREIEGK